MVARLRHIAISVPDPEKAAQFFEQAFGMKRAGKAGLGLYMSDGTVNVALLKFPGDVPGMPPGKPYYGLIHFGMWVDDLEAAEKQAIDAGAVHMHGRPPDAPKAPKATMAALVGALDHCCRLISLGAPGLVCGSIDFATMSKMPALERSLKSVVSKVRLSGAVCGSVAATALKSATAMRMLETPAEVSVLNQSCACRTMEEKRRSVVAAKSRRKGRRGSCDRGRAGRYVITFIVDAKLP